MEFEVFIENPTKAPISSIEFVAEVRKTNRTVPLASSALGGDIPAGIEPGAIEPTKWFIRNDKLGKIDSWDLPPDCELYVAISSVKYYGDNQTQSPSPPLLVKATPIAPDRP